MSPKKGFHFSVGYNRGSDLKSGSSWWLLFFVSIKQILMWALKYLLGTGLRSSKLQTLSWSHQKKYIFKILSLMKHAICFFGGRSVHSWCHWTIFLLYLWKVMVTITWHTVTVCREQQFTVETFHFLISKLFQSVPYCTVWVMVQHILDWFCNVETEKERR